MRNGFSCFNCGRWSAGKQQQIGTQHRNHCPFCLWSKHLDFKKSGDRLSDCAGPMKPIGLTFKKEGYDKYGRARQGELMLIHLCQRCGKISINRLAGDDQAETVLAVFEASFNLSQKLRQQTEKLEIKILGPKEQDEVQRQLFGQK